MTRTDVASTAYVSHLNMRIRVFVARLTYLFVLCFLDERRYYAIYRMLDLWRLTRL